VAIENVVQGGYGVGASIAFVVTGGYTGTPLGPIIIRATATRNDFAYWDGVTKRVSRFDETGGKVSALTVGDYADVLQIFGAGDAYTVATITAALNFIGSNNVTLLWSTGIWLIDSNVTIPANFSNHISAGCVFAISTGITLTFSGPVKVEYAINDGTGWYTGNVICSLGVIGFPGW